MVLPITGPIQKLDQTPNTYEVGSQYKLRQTYRQAKPYTIPLPYSMWSALTTGGKATVYITSDSWGGHWLGQWWTSTTVTAYNNSLYGTPRIGQPVWTELNRLSSLTLNRAREKFMAKANQRVSLAVDILQRKEAYDMITRRVTQAAKVINDVRKLRFGDAIRDLGLKKPADWRSVPRTAGGWWLEYSYGWKPLVQDIHDAAAVLSSPQDDLWIQESSTQPYREVFQADVGPPNNAGIHYQNVNVGKVFARVGATVSVTNPNLQALKNAGLTNPLTWAWEVIPFSFVVDWFYGVGDFLESLDDTVGLQVRDGFYTTGWKGTSQVATVLLSPYAGWPKPPLPGRNVGDQGWKSRSVAQMDRVRGLPTVKLARKLKILTNVDRGLNAASLLAQALKK